MIGDNADNIDDTKTVSGKPFVGARLPAGTVLEERYRIDAFIARGGMGEVYRAFDLELKEAIALKLLPIDALNADSLELFRREVRLARKVTSHHVCRIHEYSSVALPSGLTVHLLSMELLEGETLAQRLERGVLSEAEAQLVFEGIGRGLRAIHEAGIVHRDLKPANVFICPAATGPRVVITDFGVARGMGDSQAKSSGIVGTPLYMAPEQLLGKPVSPATDLYAVGLMLFEAFTGKLPFEGEGMEAIYARNSVEPRALPGSVSAKWKALVARCLAREPDDRLESAASFVVAAQSSAPTRARRPMQRTIGALAVFAMLVVLFAVLQIRPNQPRVAMRIVSAVDDLDAAFNQAAVRVVTRELVRDRRLVLGGDDDADTSLAVRVTPTKVGIQLEAIERGTFPRVLQTRHVVEAGSVVEAATALRERLGASLLARASPRPPSDLERLQMKRLGTEDLEAFVMLEEFTEVYFRTTIADIDLARELADRLLAHAPHWAMSAIARAVAYGVRPSDEGVSCASSTFDCDFLRWKLSNDLTPEQVANVETVFFGEPPSKTFSAMASLLLGDHLPEARWFGLFARVLEVFPDSQYGEYAAQSFGRNDPREGLLEWQRAAPESTSLAEHRATFLASAGDAAGAVEVLEAARLLNGPLIQLLVFETNIAIETADLRRADRLVVELKSSTSGFARLQAVDGEARIAVAEGRYRTALDLWEHQMAARTVYGRELVPEVALSNMLEVAHVIHDDPREAEAMKGAVAFAKDLEATTNLFLLEYDAAALRGPCPPIEPLLERAKGDHDLAATRRTLVRRAANAGCLPCSEAIELGLFGPAEFFSTSLVDFVDCARRVKRDDRALEALDMISGVMWAPSLHLTIRAHFLRAQILESLGRKDEATAQYETFLRFWKMADHATPERDAALAALARLR